MKKIIAAKCNPKEFEAGKYDFWLENEFFKSGDKTKEPFCVVIPPPNVTGKLHLGHAWDATIQDMVVRRKRMQGFDTLWLPGMDHAGIATQAKVDAKLKEQGTSRFEIGREKFLEEAFKWKDEYSKEIRKQWEILGLSLDYSKERFTLDSGLNKAVNKVFIELYNKGLIYRGNRIINWDPMAQTALSNIEVEHKEVNGKFYHFKYELEDKSGFLEVATTRPETMFGDVAVMVHPEDDRYKSFVGKKVFIPGTDKLIPIIEDDYVDMEFGSGCVKVTPAHDPNDYQVGKRHKLEMPICMNEDGTMNELCFEYNKMDRFLCRKTLVENLDKINLVIEVRDYVHSVGHSERTGVVVEPRLSKQWFVSMKKLAKRSIEVQRSSEKVNFIPKRSETTFLNWMEKIEDWCISRQLWWGHRIPAFYKGDEVVVDDTFKDDTFKQDEDVLDTWFSSALWPFSTLGWPDLESEDFKRYFPTDLLVTGYDIIFFWVSRMIFQSLEFTDKVPFKDVLIHGLIRDKDGRKMSKSLGNGVDPIEVKEKYGMDALRYFITTNSAQGEDLRFEEEKVMSSSNFINKLWNISRYVMLNTEEVNNIEIDLSKLNIFDKWILNRLNEVITKVDQHYDKYDFGETARALYNFIWDDFASWYIEISKVYLKDENNLNTKNILLHVLKNIIKLLHPFMPFVTEEIYQHLPKESKSIMISAWPLVNKEYNFDVNNEIEIIMNVIKSIRNIRNEANVSIKKQIKIIIETKKEIKDILLNNLDILNNFINPSELLIEEVIKIEEECLSSVLNNIKIFVPIDGIIDISKEIERLEKELNTLQKELKRSENMLKNEKFISKAPQFKIDNEIKKQKEYIEKYEIINKRLETLKK